MARRHLAFLLCVSLFACPAYAQFRAGLQGTVQDTTGAMVPGAKVTVTNQETNVSREVTSGDTGFYRVSSLAPGKYTVKASFSGFKEKVVKDVVVAAEETRGLDITLDPGAAAETVEVTAEAGGLHTENAEISGTLSTREVTRLPQVGRDPYELVRLAPGVFGLGARTPSGGSLGFPNRNSAAEGSGNIFATENRPEVSAAGQRAESNHIQLDGVNQDSQAWGGSAVITPNQESVKEVRVLANNYTAEFGRNTGAQIQVVSQTGTNAFHGSLFVKRNTEGLNSEQDFVQAGTGIQDAPQPVRQFLTDWGGSVGGPIIKNKLFGFFSYDRITRSSSRLEGFFVETQQLFDAIANRNNIAATIFDFVGTPRIDSVDSSRTCANSGFTEGVNCNTVAGGLDIGSINLAAIPGTAQPDTGGGLDLIPDIQFAQLILPSSGTAQQFNARVDYQVTKSDLVAFTMHWVRNDNTFNDAWGNRARPTLDFTSARRARSAALLWTRTISPTLLNEARFNVSRWYFNEVDSNPEYGWGIPKTIVCAGPNCSNWGGGAVGPGVFFQTSYNFRDTVSKVWNAHSLKFGVDYIKEQNNDRAPWAGRPTYWMGNPWNFANDFANQQGAFFDPQTGAFTDLRAYARSTYYSLFAQDDWKVRPNLTLNLGLRWEYYSPLRSANDRISNLVLGPNGDLLGASIRTGGDPYAPDRNNFGPQLGFAWSPGGFNNKLVLRGGFGVGFNRLPGSRTLEMRFNAPFFAPIPDFFGAQVVYGLASDLNGFSYPSNPNAVLTFDPNTNIPLPPAFPIGVNAVAQDIQNSYAYRYSLGLEYELGRDWIVSLGYQGSGARKLPRIVPYHLFVTPHPRISNVNLLVGDASSSFNALLAGINHRFSRGFTFSAEYRWAKSIDTCSNDHNCRQSYPFDQSTERGPSDFDTRHSFKAFGVWELPFLKGRKDWVGRLAGGWELSGILTTSSGFPWTPVTDANNCTVPGGFVCPLRPIAQIQSPATSDLSNDVFLGAGQFPGGGLLYFTPPPAGPFTIPPPPGVGRNSFRGPGYFSIDMTAVKRFALPNLPFFGEGAGLEIRANAYNLFNRLNLEPFRINDPETRIDHPRFGRAAHVLSGRVAEVQARFSF